MRFCSVTRESIEFVGWSCNMSQTEVPCGHNMARAQWIWNTQGLTVCPIEGLLSVNHMMTWECTENPECPECAVFYAGDLCRGLCETPWFVSNPCIDLCSLWSCFPVISGNLSQTSETNLFFLPRFSFPSSVFGEICLYGYHTFILGFFARKQSHLGASSYYCFWFYTFIVFCI